MNVAGTATAAPLLSVEGIVKTFPGVRALAGVAFDCRAGEIHGLVGENGAGKSTLMRVLAGVHAPDAGTIRLRGTPVAFDGPQAARRLGIAMVYQDTRLVGELDVAQNVWLGHEPGGGLIMDRAAMERETARLMARLGIAIDPRRRVAELSTAERQLVEIARALATDAAVLILDEPTSALAAGEVERLFAVLDGLRREGRSIVFISHRIPEVLRITDRVTVMKDGEVMATLDTAAADAGTLVRLMVGRDIAMAFPPKAAAPGAVRLEVSDLSVPGRLGGVSFVLRAGEIVGLGGIQGSGQRTIARAAAGLMPAQGEVRLDGQSVLGIGARRAIARGLVYVPADRRRESLFLPHSLRENVAVPHLTRWSRAGILERGREAAAAARTIERLAVRTPSPEQAVSALSGGNQQKVVFGRWLLAEPKVLILDEPTQGVDVATKLELYRLVREQAARGTAVLLLSSDVLELIGLCDRVLVVAQGRIVDEVPSQELSEERIVGAAVTSEAGATAAGAAAARAGVGYGSLLLRRYGSALLLLALILALGAYTASASPWFLTQRNLGNLALQVVPLALAALGQLAVILLAGVDLTVGPLISLTTAIASFLLAADDAGPVAAGLVACLGTGLAVGLGNGLLIRLFRIPDLVATLATYSVVFGLALIVRPSPGGSVAGGFMDAVTWKLGTFPVVAIAVLALYLVAEILLLRGRLGARLYATGASEEAAYLCGIPTARIRVIAYAFSGLAAAVAGLVIAARIGSGDPQAGIPFTLSSITATVVGGASIFGGRGTAVGTLLGCVLLILVQNALNQLHVSAYWQYIWTGALLLVAVGIYTLQRGRRT
ncbi:MAG: ATP-binding cassette domain-containing protein [Rhodospirillaceae bacterium]|nr:ATP-binding cassette domain-containing protein [Rhodospirillaceae bacterium]